VGGGRGLDGVEAIRGVGSVGLGREKKGGQGLQAVWRLPGSANGGVRREINQFAMQSLVMEWILFSTATGSGGWHGGEESMEEGDGSSITDEAASPTMAASMVAIRGLRRVSSSFRSLFSKASRNEDDSEPLPMLDGPALQARLAKPILKSLMLDGLKTTDPTSSSSSSIEDVTQLNSLEDSPSSSFDIWASMRGALTTIPTRALCLLSVLHNANKANKADRAAMKSLNVSLSIDLPETFVRDESDSLMSMDDADTSTMVNQSIGQFWVMASSLGIIVP